LKVEFIPSHLYQHERQVLVEPRGGQICPGDVMATQFGSGPRDKIGNPVLGFDPLIKVFVARQYDVDSIFHQKRFQKQTEIGIRAVTLSR
jgi:hypothetical protein